MDECLNFAKFTKKGQMSEFCKTFEPFIYNPGGCWRKCRKMKAAGQALINIEQPVPMWNQRHRPVPTRNQSRNRHQQGTGCTCGNAKEPQETGTNKEPVFIGSNEQEPLIICYTIVIHFIKNLAYNGMF